jgi:hypothetical protein
LHRLRLDDFIDRLLAPLMGFARLLDRADRSWRRVCSADAPQVPGTDVSSTSSAS